MTAKDIVAELEILATPQIKKMWMNHGAQEPCLGVKIADMKVIQKRVTKNYPLALELYDTGIADAMYLAGYLTDDKQMTVADLDKWVQAANCPWVAEFMVPWVASESLVGRDVAVKWIESKDEKVAAAGWQTYASVMAVTKDSGLDLDEITSLLSRVASTIKAQPHRVRWAMNGFVVAAGSYVVPLHDLAVKTADEIGKVETSEGKMSSPSDEIKKFAARSPIGRKRKMAQC